MTGGAVICCVALGGAALPGRAAAQGAPYVTGGLAVAGVSDSNLFSVPGAPESDFITRATPAVEAGYRSRRLSVTARYDRDLERFADHPELDTARARQRAALGLSSRTDRALTFAIHGAWETTLTPGDFNLTTGLTAGRRPARRLVYGPSVACRFNPRTRGTIAGTRTIDRLPGGLSADTQTLDLRLEREASERSAWSVDYTASRFRFEEGGAEDRSTAQSLTLGWRRDLGRRTGLALRFGPRVADGDVDPEISVALERRLKRGGLSLAYDRTLTTVFGLPGAVIAESLSTSFSCRLGRGFRLTVAPSAFRVRGAGGGVESRVRMLALEGSVPLNGWLSLTGAWHASRQEGLPGAGAPGPAGDVIDRRTVLLALSVRPPDRTAAAAPRGDG